MNLGSDVRPLLKQSNLQITSARIAVLQLFEAYKMQKRPLDAQFFIENLHFDRVTVFRMLNTFVEKGIIRKLEFGEGKARYELASREDHHHFICRSCGSIQDIEDTVLPKFIEHLEKNHDFTITNHSLEFFGLCKNCQNKQN